MLRKTAFLLVLGLIACDTGIEPSVRSSGDQFPLRATWTSTANPVGTATVRASLTIKEYLGQHMDATIQVTGGAASGVYQWRIFRGDCATTAVAASNTAPTGLLLFSTIQAYPDLTTTGGTSSMTRTIVGTLDSLTAYSVRIRVAQTATNWNGTSPLACGNLQRS
jgi:hypothetical protein